MAQLSYTVEDFTDIAVKMRAAAEECAYNADVAPVGVLKLMFEAQGSDYARCSDWAARAAGTKAEAQRVLLLEKINAAGARIAARRLRIQARGGV